MENLKNETSQGDLTYKLGVLYMLKKLEDELPIELSPLKIGSVKRPLKWSEESLSKCRRILKVPGGEGRGNSPVPGGRKTSWD